MYKLYYISFISVDLAHYEIFRAKVSKGGIIEIQCRHLKPHSHCAGVATVHPDAGQPVYRDAPGHIS